MERASEFPHARIFHLSRPLSYGTRLAGEWKERALWVYIQSEPFLPGIFHAPARARSRQGLERFVVHARVYTDALVLTLILNEAAEMLINRGAR